MIDGIRSRFSKSIFELVAVNDRFMVQWASLWKCHRSTMTFKAIITFLGKKLWPTLIFGQVEV